MSEDGNHERPITIWRLNWGKRDVKIYCQVQYIWGIHTLTGIGDGRDASKLQIYNLDGRGLN